MAEKNLKDGGINSQVIIGGTFGENDWYAMQS